MKKTLWQYRFLFLLLAQILLLKLLSQFPQTIESVYSLTIYPYWSQFLRILFGVVPFSIGDLLYLVLILYIVYWFWSTLRKKQLTRQYLFVALCVFANLFYFVFNFSWGIQYHSVSVHQHFELKPSYTCDALEAFTEQLISKTNALHLQISGTPNTTYVSPYDSETIFEKAVISYQEASVKFPFLAYHHPSVKASLISQPLSYMGFGGYFNPFTHEAQVNICIPKYNMPTTTLHEMAHQLGIAPENEANFIGYLVSINSSDVHFQYSGLTFGLKYCLRNMERLSPGRLPYLLQKINPGVVDNFIETENFHAAHQSPLEWFSKHFYDFFLKANQQADGLMGYNNFVAAMVATGLEDEHMHSN